MATLLERWKQMDGEERRRAVATAQAAYFVPTGVWAVVATRSFEAVTGPKVDRWLVKTVGVLVTAVGAPLGLAARRRRLTPEMEMIAVGSALGLTAVDVVYVARRRISPIYLLDALGELLLVAGWLLARLPPPRRAR